MQESDDEKYEPDELKQAALARRFDRQLHVPAIVGKEQDERKIEDDNRPDSACAPRDAEQGNRKEPGAGKPEDAHEIGYEKTDTDFRYFTESMMTHMIYRNEVTSKVQGTSLS